MARRSRAPAGLPRALKASIPQAARRDIRRNRTARDREAAPIARASVATAMIVNKRGLHARASAKFVETAARFQSEVTVTKGDASVSGRSIMGLMMLAASLGSSIELAAQGPDAPEAVKALLALIAAKFHEDT